MVDYIELHPWKIIENGFHPEYNEISESLFSIGNGRMGQRGMFEEKYSGHTLQGSYLAGVYYPDKTRVGWWKNGYPEYFAKVVNSINWLDLQININGLELDLHQFPPYEFRRELDMERGVLTRIFRVDVNQTCELEIKTERFCSMADLDCAMLRMELKILKGRAIIKIGSSLDSKVMNKDSNYGECFWTDFHAINTINNGFLTACTKKTDFKIGAAFMHKLKSSSNANLELVYEKISDSKLLMTTDTFMKSDETLIFEKYVSICTSFFYPDQALDALACKQVDQLMKSDFDTLRNRHSNWWYERWQQTDIVIEGDEAAQQGIRFNIFHLNQTYTGEHPLLNIGPKGFTGEKYGGSSYWDTEAYCIPYYQSTSDKTIALNLLRYRFNHLSKAIENAEKLGFSDGAALYPMVTMNGEECHNEWEITFEEIHRNGAMVYAIYDYTRYTGDSSYRLGDGLEVMIGIARFWQQRFNWSDEKSKFVMLGVTGPNEYENNVNNNWYTNYIAVWCLKYTIESLELLKIKDPDTFNNLLSKTQFDANAEVDQWQKIIDNAYFPYDDKLNIYLQQDGYMDKDQVLVKDLDPSNLPINQKWSWDRILRSCFIKQADVLQGLYFFDADFDTDTIRRNFHFYEPRTVHESSLSPCIHAILAGRIGDFAKAHEMYLRTSRLDLENFNNDTEDGLHITSMAGTWLSVVKGFGGMNVKDGNLHFAPFLPGNWTALAYNILFRGASINIRVTPDAVVIKNLSDVEIHLNIYGEDKNLTAFETWNHPRKIAMA